ncbi:hypothetical protein ADUPG1_008479 [Aduncisulcus paluster]|uniref:Uncharacterized protein n=1 Tax=Aduncisulcus paluster TaxID=2918883 RepID=A0ABQ5KUI1_9EUKA|nr:hypothetical protein ADUPG1_008479 [Aduncisulcus paluster]
MTSPKIQVIIPEFIHEGAKDSIPISRDNPAFLNPIFADIGTEKGESTPSIKASKLGKRRCSRKESLEDKSPSMNELAQQMMKGEGHRRMFYRFKYVSLPFSPSVSMKGAYICLSSSLFGASPSSLIFTFSSKGKKLSKIYKFPEDRESCAWLFLPIDLPDVSLCEIEGKGKKTEGFHIESLAFIREETPEEIITRKVRDKLCGKNDSIGKVSEEYDQSIKAQEMLKGLSDVTLSHLSIPFSSPCPMKGAYICVDKRLSSPSLLFSFTDSEGKKTSKKYEFKFKKSKHCHEWRFLPIDLANIVACDIEGRGTWIQKNSRCFNISLLLFVREETIAERIFREEKEVALAKQWSEAQKVVPKFIKNGEEAHLPIIRDALPIIDPWFSMVKGSVDLKPKEKFIDLGKSEIEKSNKSLQAQRMLKGESQMGYSNFSHLSIPFQSPSPIKGAYICLNGLYRSDSLLFTFTLSDGEKNAKKYTIPRPKRGNFWEYYWYFLPIDLFSVELCEIIGKGKWYEVEESGTFRIVSLAFVREESPDEQASREFREASIEKMWADARIVKAKYKNAGAIGEYWSEYVPIPLDDPSILTPSLSKITAKDISKSVKSEEYDVSSKAKIMLEGKKYSPCFKFSHLSIPFPSPCPIKGAYICVNRDYSLPSLLFSFTSTDGKKTFTRYEIGRRRHWHEWHFLPIDLSDIVLCEIQHINKLSGCMNNDITSLYFIRE